MGKAIDETGNRYGILTVLKRVENNKYRKAQWLCQCDCGKEIVVDGCSLRSGNTKSCGCRVLSAETRELGKRYGQLVVKEFAGRSPIDNKLLWKCECDCGNFTTVRTAHLHDGSVVSCGCKNRAVKKDEIGNRYGLLTVIEAAPSKKGYAYWKCKCNCGNIIEVSGTSLRSGNTQSCGCVHSLGESNIIKILTQNNIPFKYQYSFDDLVYKQKLRYDFAILDEQEEIIKLIEFDGPQHVKGNCWYTEAGHLRDLMKEQYAKDKNIPLIRIPYEYRDKITLELLTLDAHS